MCHPPLDEQNKKVTEFLKTILGRPVIVKLNSGVDYRGAFRRVWMHA